MSFVDISVVSNYIFTLLLSMCIIEQFLELGLQILVCSFDSRTGDLDRLPSVYSVLVATEIRNPEAS